MANSIPGGRKRSLKERLKDAAEWAAGLKESDARTGVSDSNSRRRGRRAPAISSVSCNFPTSKPMRLGERLIRLAARRCCRRSSQPN